LGNNPLDPNLRSYMATQQQSTGVRSSSEPPGAVSVYHHQQSEQQEPSEHVTIPMARCMVQPMHTGEIVRAGGVAEAGVGAGA
jgi:hypothetical protein